MGDIRFYRNWGDNKDLISSNIALKETDLYILAQKNVKRKAYKSVSKYRAMLEKYIQRNPSFKDSLVPLSLEVGAPIIVKEMVKAGNKVGVGPMAAVAGAIAEFVGRDLLDYSPEVIVENGGDIFIKSLKVRHIGIYAGNSVFTKKIAIEILPEETPLGICTSSGTVGHSLSLGNADAVVVLSPSSILADAAATAIGNLVQGESDILQGIDFAIKIKGIRGVLIIKNGRMGIWGDMKIF